MKSSSSILGLAALFGSAVVLPAQISVTGLADRTYGYNNSVTFTVVAQAGYSYLAVLDTNTIPVGQAVTVNQPDYHELRVWATNQTTAAVSTALYRFNVVVSARGGSENGLPPLMPHPTIPSAAGEFAGATLRVMAPAAFPTGFPIPVVAWVVNDAGHPVRVNGTLAGPGVSGIGIKRGVGSGFLPASADNDPVSYTLSVQSLQATKDIVIDSSPAWVAVGGTLAASTEWPANSRIEVTSTLVIPAGMVLTVGEGTIVKVNTATDIQNNGQIVINGTLQQPVVFMPASGMGATPTPAQAWGGFIQHANNASFTATGTIFTGCGYRNCWFKGHECSSGLYAIDSHRGQQALISLQGANCNLSLTDCGAIFMAGQFGHSADGSSYSYQIAMNRTLVQRGITGGEYSQAVFTVNDSAFIEFADDLTLGESPVFVDGDNDGLYITETLPGYAHSFTNTLFGWTKDDGIDSGGGGGGAFNYQNCWFESTAHEANSWSGADNASPHYDKDIHHYDGVFMNCGQGVEDGYGAPTGGVHRCLMLGNVTGARFGDNYNWTYYGFLTVNDSILIHNYRDVWGVNFQDWTYRVSSMDVVNNLLTVANTNHPANSVWDPAVDAPRLAAYLTIPPSAPVGMGFATWSTQDAIAAVTNRLPVRLSTFSTNTVTVDYVVQASTGAILDSGTLTFTPGETVKWISPNVPNPQNYSLIAVRLERPSGGEVTGFRSFYYVASSSGPSSTMLIPRGSVWSYRNLASAAPADWKTLAFDQSSWPSGAAQLGYSNNEERDETTILTNVGAITAYFRRFFNVANPAAFANLSLWLLRDDAGVVYLNGTEIYRSPNLPAYPTAISYSTPSQTPNGENTIDTATVSATNLLTGTNILAVEIHQPNATSSDLSFDFELAGVPVPSVYMANFGTDLVLYWLQSGWMLQEATRVDGGWTTVATASPYAVQPNSTQRFYRLKKL